MATNEKDYGSSRSNSESEKKEYTGADFEKKPGYCEERVWQREEREHGLSVEDWKTRNIWGSEIIPKR